MTESEKISMSGLAKEEDTGGPRFKSFIFGQGEDVLFGVQNGERAHIFQQRVAVKDFVLTFHATPRISLGKGAPIVSLNNGQLFWCWIPEKTFFCLKRAVIGTNDDGEPILRFATLLAERF